MIESALEILLRASLGATFGIVLALALRAPLRRAFGAGIAYAAWLIVPLALLVALLPGPSVTLVNLPTQLAAEPATALSAAAAAPFDRGPWALALWIVGALVHAGLALARQRRFDAALAAGRIDGPALVGFWRPRVHLPRDFEQRFDDAERALIEAHENVHRRRHDNRWNLLAALLAAAQWFNPLAAFALRRMRADQELACDAAVLAPRPQALAIYARALLKAQGSGAAAPALACQWQLSAHPLLERVAMLKSHPQIDARRRRLGRWILAALTLAGAGAVHALQPATAADGAVPRYRVAIDLESTTTVDEKKHRQQARSTVVVHDDKAVRIAFAGADMPPELQQQIELRVGTAGQGLIQLRVKWQQGDKVLAEPRLIVADGQMGRVEIAEPGAPHLRLDLTPSTLPTDTSR